VVVLLGLGGGGPVGVDGGLGDRAVELEEPGRLAVAAAGHGQHGQQGEGEPATRGEARREGGGGHRWALLRGPGGKDGRAASGCRAGGMEVRADGRRAGDGELASSIDCDRWREYGWLRRIVRKVSFCLTGRMES